MLVNFSNHISSKWSAKQTEMAELLYGTVVDLQFPSVDPNGDCQYIFELADFYVENVKQLGSPAEVTVHIMGELNLSFVVVCKLQKLGYKCVASTTERIVSEIGPDKKEVLFNFVQFREYKIQELL
jgi:hypothetical protein